MPGSLSDNLIELSGNLPERRNRTRKQSYTVSTQFSQYQIIIFYNIERVNYV